MRLNRTIFKNKAAKTHRLNGYFFSMLIALYTCIGAAKAMDVTYGECHSDSSQVKLFWCYNATKSENPETIYTSLGNSVNNTVTREDGNIFFMTIYRSNCINSNTLFIQYCIIEYNTLGNILNSWGFTDSSTNASVSGKCTVTGQNHKINPSCGSLIDDLKKAASGG